jgi:hypothetical protein
MKCITKPVITGATEIVTKVLNKNLEALPGKHSTDSLHKAAILGTSHIIRKVLQSSWAVSAESSLPLVQEEKCRDEKACYKRQYNSSSSSNNNNNIQIHTISPKQLPKHKTNTKNWRTKYVFVEAGCSTNGPNSNFSYGNNSKVTVTEFKET